MRHVFSLLLALSFGLSLPACSGSEPAPAATETAGTAQAAPVQAASAPTAPPAAAAPMGDGMSGRLEITVTSDGFVPARSKVKVGQAVTLVVTRKVERTCATEIVIPDLGIKQALPLDQTVEVKLTPAKAGPIKFSCAMDMIRGELIAE